MASKRPMTLMMISARAERIHMALMTGATAAAMGRPVTFFFSKAAVRFVTKAGWAAMQTSEGEPAVEMDSALDARGVADTEVLLDGISALNVRFIVCDSALREHDIDPTSLISRPQVEVGGLAEVIEKGEGGDWLTF